MLILRDVATVLIGMVFSRFTGVVGRMEPMPMSNMGVVRSLFVITGFMVLGSFTMMSCRVFVVFCRFVVVLLESGFANNLERIRRFPRPVTLRQIELYCELGDKAWQKAGPTAT